MFASIETSATACAVANTQVEQKKSNNVPYLPGNQHIAQDQHSISYSTIDSILEKEKNNNKTEAWNKIDKTAKIQKLHAFAEKYGREHGLPVKEIKNLKTFFVECLEKAKLQKAKDVAYNKDTQEITGIPALHFNSDKRSFTLKVTDPKRVSTLKSLTPKRVTEKSREDTDENIST
jgi:hypothetical protein